MQSPSFEITTVKLAVLAVGRALEKARPDHPLKLDALRLYDGPTLNVAVRLLENTHIKPNGCLEWMRSKDRDGYGVIYYRYSQWRVHRFVYHAWVDDIGSAMVLHHCDNPTCCHPGHLFIGDASANAKDCAAKGRLGIARGSGCWNSVLTDDDVRYIIDNYRYRTSGKMAIDFARKFKVSVGAIWGILYGRTWKHIHRGEKL